MRSRARFEDSPDYLVRPGDEPQVGRLEEVGSYERYLLHMKVAGQ